jgi:sulfate transport system ATP-binding protein
MSIVLQGLTKRYGSHAVVNDVSLSIADGEFFVLLGSSGSGKTTVLRIVAGLTQADCGRVLLHGIDVTALQPRDRNVGFVFQHYALFEHMSVADNVTFALRIRHRKAQGVRERCDELLDLVGLSGLGDRMPHQLSGGQQQRVALARALAREPDVLLLDEPLGALDARIRADLRVTLRRIQRELGLTTILVTHDQSEAFELADRLGVMSYGRLLEVGTPVELYERPRTEFVATFLGDANLLVAECTPGGIRFGAHTVPSPGGSGKLHGVPRGKGRVQLLFRPEHVTLRTEATGAADALIGPCVVTETTYAGSHQRLRLRVADGRGTRQLAPAVSFGQQGAEIHVLRSSCEAESLPLASGQEVWAEIRHTHVLQHPGLRLAVVFEQTRFGDVAAATAGRLARHAHARVLLLRLDQDTPGGAPIDDRAHALLSGASAIAERSIARADLPQALCAEDDTEVIDLVVTGAPLDGRGNVLAALLGTCGRNILMAGDEPSEMARPLVCVAGGEPGRHDVEFAARVLRHVAAGVVLMTVVPESSGPAETERRARFMRRAAASLEAMGVATRSHERTGVVADEIVAAMEDGQHDLLVMGTPLPHDDGRFVSSGVVPSVVTRVRSPIMLVRYAPDGAQAR